MGVALAAANGEPHPGRGRGVHPVQHVGGLVLLRDGAALVVDGVIPIETRGNQLSRRGVGQQVARELLDGEDVKRLVLVIRADHPVSPQPHGAAAVDVVTVGVGISGGVQPAQGHPLAVVGRGEQSVHQPLVGAGLAIIEKGRNFGESGRQAGKIEAESADERAPVGHGRGPDTLLLQPGEDEMVDGVDRPLLVAQLGQLGLLGRDEGPMALVLRPLLDPTGQGINLRRRQAFAAAVGRHPASGSARDSAHEGAGARLAGNDGGVARFQSGVGAFRRVQSQSRHALLVVETMTGEAVVRQDRTDVAIKIDGRPLRSG